jgi:biotin carboxyl carrier protein
VRASAFGVFRCGTSAGARVDADDVIGLLEVARRRDEIRAGEGGLVRVIHAEDGAVVEYGQLLFTIEPDGRQAAH